MPARPPLPAGFFTIWTTVAIDLVGFGIVLPILPQYAEKLGVSPTTIGAIVASFSMAQLALAPVLGRLSDRFGRKPLLILSLVGTAVGSLLTGLAGSVALLFLGRIIDGASGASVSVAQAAATDLAEPDDRPRLLGLLGAAFGVGFVLGPAIGALGALGGIHVPFFIAAAIAATNAIVALRRLPETNPEHLRRAEPAAGAGAESLDHERRSSITRLVAVAFVSMVAFAGFEATFALLVERRFGFELPSTAVVFTAIGLALVVVQGGLVHPVTSRLGETRTIRVGLVANVVGLALLSVDGGWLTMAPALLALVLGQGLLSPTLSSAVAGLAGRRRGQVLGWQQSAGGLARVVGPLAGGALFEHVSFGSPYLLGAVLAAAAFLAVPRARPTAPNAAAPDEALPGLVGT